MKTNFLFFSLLLLSHISFSQSGTSSSPDSIKVKDTLGMKGSFFTKEEFSYQGKEQLMYKDIKHLLEKDKESSSLNSSAQALKVLSYVLALPGGFLVGYSLGTAIGGKPLDPALLGIGAGLIVVAIPVGIGYNGTMRKAVRAYNRRPF